LLFALRKFKQNADAIKTTMSCTVGRNEDKRMRVTHINATLNLGKEANQFENLERILAQFEDFCTVSQSVQAGIPITIRVEDSTGAVLK
jgi:organic hydroperoxide reductase OsmC/OhrA